MKETTLEKLTDSVMQSAKFYWETHKSIITKAMEQCIFLSALVWNDGLLALGGLHCFEIGEQPLIQKEVHMICGNGILDAVEWNVIEREVMEFYKGQSWTSLESVLFVLYVNSYRFIQQGLKNEELLEKLIFYVNKEDVLTVHGKLQKIVLEQKNSIALNELMEQAEEKRKLRQKNISKEQEQMMERFYLQFPKPAIGNFSIGFDILDFFPDEILEQTIQQFDICVLTSALIFAKEETVERFLWQCSTDVCRYLATKWAYHMENYMDNECMKSMQLILEKFHENCNKVGISVK